MAVRFCLRVTTSYQPSPHHFSFLPDKNPSASMNLMVRIFPLKPSLQQDAHTQKRHLNEFCALWPDDSCHPVCARASSAGPPYPSQKGDQHSTVPAFSKSSCTSFGGSAVSRETTTMKREETMKAGSSS